VPARDTPQGQQRLRDAAGADTQLRRLPGALPQQAPDDRELRVPGDVQQDRLRSFTGRRRRQRVDLRIDIVSAVLVGTQVERHNRRQSLPRQMQPEVGLAHRRHRMAAHRRMAVDAQHRSTGLRRRK
jgi:hypothetical protein